MLVIRFERVPVANENDITPTIIKNMQKTFSAFEYAVISPYPTVRTVVTVKYIELTYRSLDLASVYPL